MLTGIMIRGVVIVAVILACATGLTACFGLLVAADYFAYTNILPPVYAALAAAGTALLFCLVALIVGKIILSGMKRRARRSIQARVAATIGEIFGKELGDLADQYPTRVLGIALAAGFALGFSPTLRRALGWFVRR
ncbi:MAG TPA: hypothetical protein VHX61_16360 [Rhizomicrobium sp.]|nr:hypothetical protein [Rhizomicrobium sp.]